MSAHKSLLITLYVTTVGISLLVAASQTEESDNLWGISSDPFPFQSPLKEMQVRSKITLSVPHI